jgi:hypothetical protein
LTQFIALLERKEQDFWFQQGGGGSASWKSNKSFLAGLPRSRDMAAPKRSKHALREHIALPILNFNPTPWISWRGEQVKRKTICMPPHDLTSRWRSATGHNNCRWFVKYYMLEELRNGTV